MTEDVSASELDYVQVDRALVERAIEALDSAKHSGLKVVTAESCTGGLVATVLSEAPGAAEFFAGGFVTYTPEQKCAALKLDPLLIDKHGAVSEEVANAMARDALACSRADLAVSVTGVAGPEPDERGNPVGLVYFACTRKGGKCVGVKREFGDIGRSRVRYAAALEALALIARVAREQSDV
ncbi:MAG TPA: CinA family protein [Methyloceanibacter sp.]|nr:CinA family protein [Methyloceanibacter sp.]